MARRGPEGRPINIGLIGLGNVGLGVARYFHDGGGERHNIHLSRVAVADPTRPREFAVPKLTGEAADIFGDPTINIVVELIGGINPAQGFMHEAIGRGKSVVTANKAVMAAYAKDLFTSATQAGVDIGYEASVAGGIPIIGTLQRYKGEKIQRIMGVLNGTTNFILTQMDTGLSFDAALKVAQERGFAEANHLLDTGGFDTRDKLAILASLIFNAQVDPNGIECQGITDITPVDLDFAKKYGVEAGGAGYAVKLLAVADKKNGSVELRVNPALIKKDNPLAAVMDEVNGVTLEGELAGSQTFIGKGAGRKPTTSAVVSDILRIADNIRNGVPDALPTLDEQVIFESPTETAQPGYIRVNLLHQPGSIHAITGILANHGLNVQDSVQRSEFAHSTNQGLVIPDIITVDAVSRRIVRDVLGELEQANCVSGKPVFMSIEQ